jgi:hypothetical protein
VTVLHGPECCSDAFSDSDEADEVVLAALCSVGADDALVTFDAQGRNHRKPHGQRVRACVFIG